MDSIKKSLVSLFAAVAVATTVGAGTPALAQPPGPPPEAWTVGNGPEQQLFPPAFAYNFVNPNVAPAGANDWNCKPSPEHPRPVVLVHGTWVNEYNSFARMAPQLERDGYCVFAAVHGKEVNSLIGKLPVIRGTDDIAVGGGQVATFVDEVLARTGAKQVDMVGYSLGGPVVRQYLRFNGGADLANPANNKVKRVVTLGATNHGTTLSGIATLASQIQALGPNILGLGEALLGQSPIQQVIGSPSFERLNAGGDTDPGIEYTILAARYDEISTPPERTFLTAGPGATVRNIWVQDGCEADLSDHLAMMYSPRGIYLVENSLDPERFPLDKAPCVPVAPLFGG